MVAHLRKSKSPKTCELTLLVDLGKWYFFSFKDIACLPPLMLLCMAEKNQWGRCRMDTKDTVSVQHRSTAASNKLLRFLFSFYSVLPIYFLTQIQLHKVSVNAAGLVSVKKDSSSFVHTVYYLFICLFFRVQKTAHILLLVCIWHFASTC